MCRDTLIHHNTIRNLLFGLIFPVCLIVVSCGKKESTYNFDPTTSTDNTSTDTTPPILTEVTVVTTPTNDTTPNYTFSSTEA
jgi:beta-lactamase regulating signal transducer with metallopeptidase domain